MIPENRFRDVALKRRLVRTAYRWAATTFLEDYPILPESIREIKFNFAGL
jgi:hypothetical protein